VAKSMGHAAAQSARQGGGQSGSCARRGLTRPMCSPAEKHSHWWLHLCCVFWLCGILRCPLRGATPGQRRASAAPDERRQDECGVSERTPWPPARAALLAPGASARASEAGAQSAHLAPRAAQNRLRSGSGRGTHNGEHCAELAAHPGAPRLPAGAPPALHPALRG